MNTARPDIDENLRTQRPPGTAAERAEQNLSARCDHDFFVQFWQTLSVFGGAAKASGLIVLGKPGHRTLNGFILNDQKELLGRKDGGLEPSPPGEKARHALVPDGGGHAGRFL